LLCISCPNLLSKFLPYHNFTSCDFFLYHIVRKIILVRYIALKFILVWYTTSHKNLFLCEKKRLTISWKTCHIMPLKVFVSCNMLHPAKFFLAKTYLKIWKLSRPWYIAQKMVFIVTYHTSQSFHHLWHIALKNTFPRDSQNSKSLWQIPFITLKQNLSYQDRFPLSQAEKLPSRCDMSWPQQLSPSCAIEPLWHPIETSTHVTHLIWSLKRGEKVILVYKKTLAHFLYHSISSLRTSISWKLPSIGNGNQEI